MKIGRNAPCPCGSGKKYKKCCLNKGKEQYLAEAIMYSFQNIKRESQIKRCLHPNSSECSDRIVKAHAIQNNRILNKIGESGMVVTMDGTMHHLFQTSDVKGRSIATTFTGFCSYHDKTVFQEIEDKEFVASKKQIFHLIIKQAFYNNMPYNKEKYFDFLALLFQSFYAFIFREGETLNQNYRDSLRDTFAIEFSTETIVKMSASWLLRINVQEILRAIGRRIQSGSDSLERRFENFPSFMMAKTVVWTLEFNVDFMLILYLVFNDEVGFYSIYEAFFNWGAINDECKISILEELQNQFDMETGLLKDDFVKQYKQYENLLKHSSNITEQIQIKLFQYICEAHSNLRKKKIIESEPRPIDIDYKDVMTRINELMKKDGIFGWNSQYFTEDYVKFVMPDYISRRAYRTPQNTARTIQRGIIEALKSYIQQRANKLTLTFDIDGVKNMLTFICENKYDARNYTYTDDWSLAKLRNEPEFTKLEEKQKEIEFVGTPQIYDNLYFNKEKFCFNIKISKMDFIDLSERECEAFLEDSKGYNGLYNVDGALMPKEEAMKCIKKSYCKERYSFKLMVSFGKNDVTRIEFEH